MKALVYITIPIRLVFAVLVVLIFGTFDVLVDPYHLPALLRDMRGFVLPPDPRGR